MENTITAQWVKTCPQSAKPNYFPDKGKLMFAFEEKETFKNWTRNFLPETTINELVDLYKSRDFDGEKYIFAGNPSKLYFYTGMLHAKHEAEMQGIALGHLYLFKAKWNIHPNDPGYHATREFCAKIHD